MKFEQISRIFKWINEIRRKWERFFWPVGQNWPKSQGLTDRRTTLRGRPKGRGGLNPWLHPRPKARPTRPRHTSSLVARSRRSSHHEQGQGSGSSRDKRRERFDDGSGKWWSRRQWLINGSAAVPNVDAAGLLQLWWGERNVKHKPIWMESS
jgi:hypothetical protein